MPRTATAFALALPVRDPDEPATEWLCTALRAEILDGRLAAGVRLPSTRELGRQCGLARGTIVRAFGQLRAEGYLTGSVGSGTYVSRGLPDDLLQVARRASTRAPVSPVVRRHSSGFARRLSGFADSGYRPVRAFRANEPALELFPTTLWAQVAGRCLRRASVRHLSNCEPCGHLPLRQAIAEYLGAARGANCAAEQVVIVSGVQEALDLTARLMLERGDRVVMENPGYPGAAAVFDAAGARVSPVALDADGMLIPSARLRGVRLAYVTPAHQYPTGIAMSVARRLALLEWARESNALIFEDDYDSEYRYSGRPLPALQGLDRSGVVLFAGSFSKVLFPSLRLGYLVVPSDLVDRFAALKSLTSRHAQLLDQIVLGDFITEGHFGRHIRRMREVYAERLGVLIEGARTGLAGLLDVSEIEAGLQTAGWLHSIDGVTAQQAAARRGVEVTAFASFTRGRVVRDGLQLGFAALEPREIRRGVIELAAALESLVGHRA